MKFRQARRACGASHMGLTCDEINEINEINETYEPNVAATNVVRLC